MPITHINTYIKYIDNYFGLVSNILTMCSGMAGMKIGSRKNYYSVCDAPYDPMTDFKKCVGTNIDKQIINRRILCNPVCIDTLTYPSHTLIIGQRYCGKTTLCKKIIDASGKSNICIFVSDDDEHCKYKEYGENVFIYSKEQLYTRKDTDLYIFDVSGVNTKHICNFIRENNINVVLTIQIETQIQSYNNELFDNIFLTKTYTDVFEQQKINKHFTNIKYF